MVLGFYLGGCLFAAAKVSIKVDKVVLAYTPRSSMARQAIEAFNNSHPKYTESLNEENVDVTVELKPEQFSKKDYKVCKIIQGNRVIYQAIDTLEEFLFIYWHFGFNSEFTCNDIFESSVLEIDCQALISFVSKYIAHLPLNTPANLKLALFFGKLCKHYLHDSRLLCSALRELKSTLKLEKKAEQPTMRSAPSASRLPMEDRQLLGEQVGRWFCLEPGEEITLEEKCGASQGKDAVPQGREKSQ
jgi:hypothetical protein